MTKPSPRRQAAAAMASVHGAFARDVLAGLSQPSKSLPPRWFYDAEGSRLFEAITELPEYYPTRTEIGILTAHAGALMAKASTGTALVELGSGSSRKTELLIAAAPGLGAYVPIDVSPTALAEARERLRRRFPALEVETLEADFTSLERLPVRVEATALLGFFPGSTIGNFYPPDALGLLRRYRHLLRRGGRLVIGVDLVKDRATLERAYDDAQGVTARFNLNLLHRMNRELGACIDVGQFRHKAFYDPALGRIEMHLEALHGTAIEVLGHRFALAAGETIHTECSYKYTVDGFQALARKAGWTPGSVLVDSDALFSVHELL